MQGTKKLDISTEGKEDGHGSRGVQNIRARSEETGMGARIE